MRRGLLNKRRDANEPGIIAALRAVGATVQQLSGKDIPDLLVGHRGANYVLEVKNRDGFDTVSVGQEVWMNEWRGQVQVVYDRDEALAAIGVKARRTG